MSLKAEILGKQLKWATSAGLSPDERGYLNRYEINLFQPLNPKSRADFEHGSGSELRDRPNGPAKMRALHSSSALAVNFFDVWVAGDAKPLRDIFGLAVELTDIRFEAQYPTGLPGKPPNLDVVFELKDGRTVGIESKFTEWLAPKSITKPSFKDKYFPTGSSVWGRVGLPETQRLAEEVRSKELVFRHLDAPQLMKHALGLATHCGSEFQLFYVYFDGNGPEGERHREEIEVFTRRLQPELGFQAFSYQDLIAGLQNCSGVSGLYLDYLRARYA